MGYIKEFQKRINKRDFNHFLQLWEEYLTCDAVDVEELKTVLTLIKESDFRISFGSYVESGLELCSKIEDPEAAFSILTLIYDLQNTNSEKLREYADEILEQRYGSRPSFKEWQRIAKIRGNANYQGVFRKVALLNHMSKGKFVYHTGGWGTGEIMDLSPIREEVEIDFENLGGIKRLSFNNAFNVLEPIQSDSFLAKRFFDPDAFEKEARKDPVGIFKLYLQNLGPKNAQEIKEDFLDLVIPEKDWAKWWQSLRNKLKKDPLVHVPRDHKTPFCLREEAVSLKDHYQEVQVFEGDLDRFIPALYAFIRDVPDALKEPQIAESIKETLLSHLNRGGIPLETELQLSLFLEQYFNFTRPEHSVKQLVQKIEHPEEINISILALKKRILETLRKERGDWVELFVKAITLPEPAIIRDYLLKELAQGEGIDKLKTCLDNILKDPKKDPEFFFWYFQKVLGEAPIPYATFEGRGLFLEGVLMVLAAIEHDEDKKDLVKKIYNLLSQKRYELIRILIEGRSATFLQEFLLLASKCHTFKGHEQKTFRSLVAVVDDSFSSKELIEDRTNPDILWVTRESMEEAQERIKQIGTVEVVENAKEIEEARALGDLRENSEYKFAQEKRRRLQNEMKQLSHDIQRARVITQDDVDLQSVGIGNKVHLKDAKGRIVDFTILGPWDADPNQRILSSQSQLAQEMLGKKVGDSFSFKEDFFHVEEIRSIFE